ncbi:hypothetical protein Ocin01_08083 [Orchesella cincta]|uniref:Uncharacterized protein n=1 Tax=Orchesella cincta TaxID=48709 RepID=A0A1D2N106_ORCCI|nr:hypothetical protein Ocin01_08083 [Orchesella cincta]
MGTNRSVKGFTAMHTTLAIFAILNLASCQFPFNSVQSNPKKDAMIPLVIRGAWFSREKNINTYTEFDDRKMSNRGFLVDVIEEHHVNYTFILQQDNCYHCVRIFVRTVNILEKIETGCINFPKGRSRPTPDEVCRSLNPDQNLITLFSENPIPVNCRSSLEGVWQFAYQNRFRFTGECDHPEALLQSCQTPGTQFLITNQKFNITYKACEGMTGTFDGTVEYSCLGDWFVGKNHFFAVVNTKESRKDEKYRCFLRNRDDDLFLAASITAECNTLKGTESAPERLRITPVKSEIVTPGCKLPQNYSGDWINTANLDADVVINSTHVVETWWPDEGRYRKTVYVCKEARGSRYMMARLTVDGCQKDFICFDFVPRHHNIIRYRKSLALINDDFATVCSWVQFKNLDAWKYDLMLAKNPVSIPCPVRGYFEFFQRGLAPFETRIWNGITDSPRPRLNCNRNISSFRNCDIGHNEIVIDVEQNVCVDYLGRPLDIYTKNPVPIRCPVAGKFNFTQTGEVPFETRILGGVTQSPRPGTYCKVNISDFSVCDQDQKEVTVDETYCLTVDYLGRPVDIYSDPDYKMKCIGYWKENLKSYLITYDELDAFSRYRCWVYQREDLNRVRMSLALGPFCSINQTVSSSNYTEGAAVSLIMEEYERERDQCPMNFDDGSNPYKEEGERIITFFKGLGGSSTTNRLSFLAFAISIVYVFLH